MEETKTFIYQIPAWAAKLLCLVYFGISVVFFMAYYHYNAWAGHSPSFLRYVFVVISLVFLLVALKPRNRKAWVYLSANKDGLYFPLEQRAVGAIPQLHVPWNKVGDIKRENIYNGKMGFTVELLVSDDEIHRYFKRGELTNKLLGIDNYRGGYYVAAFSQKTCQPISKVVAILNQLKRCYS